MREVTIGGKKYIAKPWTLGNYPEATDAMKKLINAKDKKAQFDARAELLAAGFGLTLDEARDADVKEGLAALDALVAENTSPKAKAPAKK